MSQVPNNLRCVGKMILQHTLVVKMWLHIYTHILERFKPITRDFKSTVRGRQVNRENNKDQKGPTLRTFSVTGLVLIF